MKQWNHQGIIDRFEANRNEVQAVPMAAYMKNHFPFLGIKSLMRQQLLKEQFKEYKLPEKDQLFEEAWNLYRLPEREYQYAAIALLEKMKKHLTIEDLPHLRQLIESKSWWDSVDAIAPKLVGHIVLRNREQGEKYMIAWSQSGNMWTNRAAILHQLKYKKETNTALLSTIIEQHSDSGEFFIQKSIGWVLREYAKTDPDWVQTFVASHSLKPLSIREALKHLPPRSGKRL